MGYQDVKFQRDGLIIINKGNEKQGHEEISFKTEGKETEIKITHSPKGQSNRVWQTMSIKLNENSKEKLIKFLNKK